MKILKQNRRRSFIILLVSITISTLLLLGVFIHWYNTGYIDSKFLDKQLSYSDLYVKSKIEFDESIDQSLKNFVTNYILNNSFERESIVLFKSLSFSISNSTEAKYIRGNYRKKDGASFDVNRIISIKEEKDRFDVCIQYVLETPKCKIYSDSGLVIND